MTAQSPRFPDAPPETPVSALSLASTVVVTAIVLLLPHFAAAGSLDQSTPVAMVTDVGGMIHLMAGDQEMRSLHLFDRLLAGDRISSDPGGTAVIAFLDGTRYQVLPGTRATIEASGLRATAGEIRGMTPVATTPAIGAIPATRQPGLSSGAVRIRKPGRSGYGIDNLYPRDHAAVPADRAVLTFSPVSNVEGYKLDVENDQGETVFALETRSEEVTIPENVLRVGTEYYWRVRTVARGSLRMRSEALFITLAEEKATWLAQIEPRLREENTVAASVLLAEIYQGLDMYRESCSVLLELAEQQPQRQDLREAPDLFLCDEYH